MNPSCDHNQHHQAAFSSASHFPGSPITLTAPLYASTQNLYDWSRVRLGVGATGAVFLGRCRFTGALVAVKRKYGTLEHEKTEGESFRRDQSGCNAYSNSVANGAVGGGCGMRESVPPVVGLEEEEEEEGGNMGAMNMNVDPSFAEPVSTVRDVFGSNEAAEGVRSFNYTNGGGTAGDSLLVRESTAPPPRLLSRCMEEGWIMQYIGPHPCVVPLLAHIDIPVETRVSSPQVLSAGSIAATFKSNVNSGGANHNSSSNGKCDQNDDGRSADPKLGVDASQRMTFPDSSVNTNNNNNNNYNDEEMKGTSCPARGAFPCGGANSSSSIPPPRTLSSYVVMELMDTDLANEIKRGNTEIMEERIIMHLAFRIVSALHHLHSHGVAHRDVKPSNILLRHASCDAVYVEPKRERSLKGSAPMSGFTQSAAASKGRDKATHASVMSNSLLSSSPQSPADTSGILVSPKLIGRSGGITSSQKRTEANRKSNAAVEDIAITPRNSNNTNNNNDREDDDEEENNENENEDRDDDDDEEEDEEDRDEEEEDGMGRNNTTSKNNNHSQHNTSNNSNSGNGYYNTSSNNHSGNRKAANTSVVSFASDVPNDASTSGADRYAKRRRDQQNQERQQQQQQQQNQERQQPQEETQRVTSTVKVCLGDFGSAHLVPGAVPSWLSTISRVTDEAVLAVRGTLYYKPPEQLMGKLAASAGCTVDYFASDMWALGCTLYEVAAGAVAFCGSSDLQVLNQIYARMGSDYQTFPSQCRDVTLFESLIHPSRTFVDFLSRLLTLNPRERLTTEEALRHPFFHPITFPSISSTSAFTNRAPSNLSARTGFPSSPLEPSSPTYATPFTSGIVALSKIKLKGAKRIDSANYKFRPLVSQDRTAASQSAKCAAGGSGTVGNTGRCGGMQNGAQQNSTSTAASTAVGKLPTSRQNEFSVLLFRSPGGAVNDGCDAQDSVQQSHHPSRHGSGRHSSAAGAFLPGIQSFNVNFPNSNESQSCEGEVDRNGRGGDPAVMAPSALELAKDHFHRMLAPSNSSAPMMSMMASAMAMAAAQVPCSTPDGNEMNHDTSGCMNSSFNSMNNSSIILPSNTSNAATTVERPSRPPHHQTALMRSAYRSPNASSHKHRLHIPHGNGNGGGKSLVRYMQNANDSNVHGASGPPPPPATMDGLHIQPHAVQTITIKERSRIVLSQRALHEERHQQQQHRLMQWCYAQHSPAHNSSPSVSPDAFGSTVRNLNRRLEGSSSSSQTTSASKNNEDERNLRGSEGNAGNDSANGCERDGGGSGSYEPFHRGVGRLSYGSAVKPIRFDDEDDEDYEKLESGENSVSANQRQNMYRHPHPSSAAPFAQTHPEDDGGNAERGNEDEEELGNSTQLARNRRTGTIVFVNQQLQPHNMHPFENHTREGSESGEFPTAGLPNRFTGSSRSMSATKSTESSRSNSSIHSSENGSCVSRQPVSLNSSSSVAHLRNTRQVLFGDSPVATPYNDTRTHPPPPPPPPPVLPAHMSMAGKPKTQTLSPLIVPIIAVSSSEAHECPSPVSSPSSSPSSSTHSPHRKLNGYRAITLMNHRTNTEYMRSTETYYRYMETRGTAQDKENDEREGRVGPGHAPHTNTSTTKGTDMNRKPQVQRQPKGSGTMRAENAPPNLCAQNIDSDLQKKSQFDFDKRVHNTKEAEKEEKEKEEEPEDMGTYSSNYRYFSSSNRGDSNNGEVDHPSNEKRAASHSDQSEQTNVEGSTTNHPHHLQGMRVNTPLTTAPTCGTSFISSSTPLHRTRTSIVIESNDVECTADTISSTANEERKTQLLMTPISALRCPASFFGSPSHPTHGESPVSIASFAPCCVGDVESNLEAKGRMSVDAVKPSKGVSATVQQTSLPAVSTMIPLDAVRRASSQSHSSSSCTSMSSLPAICSRSGPIMLPFVERFAKPEENNNNNNTVVVDPPPHTHHSIVTRTEGLDLQPPPPPLHPPSSQRAATAFPRSNSSSLSSGYCFGNGVKSTQNSSNTSNGGSPLHSNNHQSKHLQPIPQEQNPQQQNSNSNSSSSSGSNYYYPGEPDISEYGKSFQRRRTVSPLLQQQQQSDALQHRCELPPLALDTNANSTTTTISTNASIPTMQYQGTAPASIHESVPMSHALKHQNETTHGTTTASSESRNYNNNNNNNFSNRGKLATIAMKQDQQQQQQRRRGFTEVSIPNATPTRKLLLLAADSPTNMVAASASTSALSALPMNSRFTYGVGNDNGTNINPHANQNMDATPRRSLSSFAVLSDSIVYSGSKRSRQDVQMEDHHHPRSTQGFTEIPSTGDEKTPVSGSSDFNENEAQNERTEVGIRSTTTSAHRSGVRLSTEMSQTKTSTPTSASTVLRGIHINEMPSTRKPNALPSMENVVRKKENGK